MEYVAIAFRSRSLAIRFYEFLSGFGVRGEIINTPSEAGVGCGLSVKVSRSAYPAALAAARKFGGEGLAGVFLTKTAQGRRTVIRLI